MRYGPPPTLAETAGRWRNGYRFDASLSDDEIEIIATRRQEERLAVFERLGREAQAAVFEAPWWTLKQTLAYLRSRWEFPRDPDAIAREVVLTSPVADWITFEAGIRGETRLRGDSRPDRAELLQTLERNRLQARGLHADQPESGLQPVPAEAWADLEIAGDTARYRHQRPSCSLVWCGLQVRSREVKSRFRLPDAYDDQRRYDPAVLEADLLDARRIEGAVSKEKIIGKAMLLYAERHDAGTEGSRGTWQRAYEALLQRESRGLLP